MIRKKLIEVALPLEAINRESAHEKDVKVGKPTSVHHWWARRPLAACRAVLFASLVDDPSSHPEEFPTEEDQEAERERLFGIIEELVKWENTSNERVLEAARKEILKSTDGNPPSVLDPFCGGGSIPLEAQRLGLTAYASDLNPVAVVITKALIEIPPKFAGMPPVNPESRARLDYDRTWIRTEGLAEDIRYYGGWVRDEAAKRIGHLYPKAKIDGSEATIIAWIWARTVECPNPACAAAIPMVQSFELSVDARRRVWIEPRPDRLSRTTRFVVREGAGDPPAGTKVGRGAKFRCLDCGETVQEAYVRSEGRAGRLSRVLMAAVAEGKRRRLYLSPEDIPTGPGIEGSLRLPKQIDAELPDNPRYISPPLYGMTTFRSLFTERQLAALSNLLQLLEEVRGRVVADAGIGVDALGSAQKAEYSSAIVTYLCFAIDRVADWGNTLSRWEKKAQVPQQVFGLQTLSMTWDFAECNPLSSSTGSFIASVKNVARSVEALPTRSDRTAPGVVVQLDATRASLASTGMFVCTDPPYYDNIGYANLSDFFYLWMRSALNDDYADVLSTLLTPKDDELVADPYRHNGDRHAADAFFRNGLNVALTRLRLAGADAAPMTLFYAFKQAEEESRVGNRASTGWESMLSALISSGFLVEGTWPIRTEMGSRRRGQLSNALASSIVLVCRARLEDAPMATRNEFLATLRKELPGALRHLQRGNIAPVDLAQAAIGPGMAVFSRCSKVVEADGSRMKVRDALATINQVLDETLSEQEAEFDAATRWSLAWFESYGTGEGDYGVAETLSKAKNTAVEALALDGFLVSKAGKVRLLTWPELPEGWDLATDKRLTIWEVTHYIIRAHQDPQAGSEKVAADLLQKVGHAMGETARDLAYRLYSISERKGWAQEALAYNSLVVAWPEIARLAAAAEGGAQASLQV